MNIVKGKITIESMYDGSKSQGEAAILTTDDGRNYILYRAGRLPQNDKFFAPANNSIASVTGSIEEENGYICVKSISLADGTLLEANEEQAAPAASIFIGDVPVQNDSPETKAPNGKKQRLPRKLKKQLKKIKNNNNER